MIGHDIGRAATACVLAFTVAGAAPPPGRVSPATHTFEGRWSALGRRHTLPAGTGRPAVIVQLSGAVVLTTATGLARGFRGEAIGFDDGRNISAGAAAWTDTRGNQVFSTFTGSHLQTGQRLVGLITGGTGPYAGITGEYAMTWQYVATGENEMVQGRAPDLKGSIRRDAAGP
jgi:hypothetical protein